MNTFGELVQWFVQGEQEIARYSDVIRTFIQLAILGAILFALWRETSLRVLRGAVDDMNTRIEQLDKEVRTLRKSLRVYGCRRAPDCEDWLQFVDDFNLDEDERG